MRIVGQEIAVIERDEYGDPCDVSVYIFIAEVEGYVICAPSVNGECNAKYILQYCAEDSANMDSTCLVVVRNEDVYNSYDEAAIAGGFR